MPAQQRFYLPPRPRFIWTSFYTTKTSPWSLGKPSIYAAWRAQYLRRLASPVFTPLGEPSIYAAWRAQYLSRLVGSVFIPLGEPSIYAAWWGQYLSRLAGPVFTPLGDASVYGISGIGTGWAFFIRSLVQ